MDFNWNSDQISLYKNIIEFAKNEFERSQNIEGSDETQQAVLESLAWQAGKKVSDLVTVVEFPELLDYLWRWFVDLNNERGSNGFGLNPLDSTKLKDWCWRTGNSPTKWEMEVIVKLGRVFDEAQPKPKADKK